MKPGPTRYQFSPFHVDFDAESGKVETIYEDGGASTAEVTAEDEVHGDLLGIPPEYHRLATTLAHHLVGLEVLQYPFGSYVFDLDRTLALDTGKGLSQHLPDLSDGRKEQCQRERRLAVALIYHAMDRYPVLKEKHGSFDESPLIEIASFTDLNRLGVALDWLLEAPIGSTIDLRGAEW